MIPLESFLSCHKCTQETSLPTRPFLFLAFEDLNLSWTGTEYTDKKTTKRPLARHPVLDSYKIIHKGIDYGSIGESLRCLNLDSASLYSNTLMPLNELITTFTSNLEICALFIVNTLRYTLAQVSIIDSALIKDSVFCGACNPGYRPILYSEIYRDIL